jgi:hypothetical protein
VTALDALHLDHAQYGGPVAPQFQDFMLWIKTKLTLGVPVIFTVYLSGSSDPDYDHIMPATGIASSNLPAYDATDVLTFDNNFGLQLMHAVGTMSGTRASCAAGLSEGGCVPQDVDYGTAVNGITDTQHATLPTTATVAQSSEPNVSQGAAPSQMNATVTVSGLQPGRGYALLRYDDYTKVPTNVSPAGFLASAYTHRTDFTATAAQWTQLDATPFVSSGVAYYRCVPR